MIKPGETTKLFLLRPGYVKSHDGDVHYISAQQLIDLYKVRPIDCLIDDPERLRGYTKEAIRSLYPLTPRQDGNYPDLSRKVSNEFAGTDN